MNVSSKYNPIPKAIALVIVTTVVAWLTVRFDASALAKMNSMTPTDYVQHQRELHQHSLGYHFVVFLIFGGFYLGAVELIGFVVNSALPAKRDA